VAATKNALEMSVKHKGELERFTRVSNKAKQRIIVCSYPIVGKQDGIVVTGMTIQTNRDLYLAIAQLIQEHKLTSRSLEAYLRSLWLLASEHQALPGFSAAAFFDILNRTFSASVPPFNEVWRQQYNEDNDDLSGYAAWQATILRQIVDLREMDEQGILKDKYRYFGINSPRGQRWYNFDPGTFLECAMAGTYSGWQPDDQTGRAYVPGKVAVLNEEGQWEERDPADLPNPIYSIGQVSWDNFRDFLYAGQLYE
jgi:hypothetical protein